MVLIPITTCINLDDYHALMFFTNEGTNSDEGIGLFFFLSLALLAGLLFSNFILF